MPLDKLNLNRQKDKQTNQSKQSVIYQTLKSSLIF
jgi:hypothetical protein